MAVEKRLGRGLESLLGAAAGTAERPAVASSEIRQVPIAQIKANPRQPRRAFPERELAELADSIRSVGVLQPLVVRRTAGGYELIAGERRLRAAKVVGLTTVPVVEREASDDELLTLALVENLHREDLNPIEKAKAFRELIERNNLTQEEAARRIGKDRATIANFIRLLDLPESVQHIVSRGTISMGHARALLGIPQPSVQQALALRIEEEGLSVRQVEKLVAEYAKHRPRRARTAPAPQKSPHLKDLEQRAREKFGTKVTIDFANGKGALTIHLYSDDDLQRVLELLGLAG